MRESMKQTKRNNSKNVGCESRQKCAGNMERTSSGQKHGVQETVTGYVSEE